MTRIKTVKNEDIFAYINELLEKIDKDEKYKSILFSNVEKTLSGNSKRASTNNKDYQIIGKIVNDEFGGTVISDTTIWRLIKIRNESEDVYNKVISGKISIKKAYNDLFNVKEKQSKPKEEVVKKYEFPLNEEPDFDKINSLLINLNEQLTSWRGKLSEDPSMNELKEIDTQVFHLRKNIGWIISRLQGTDMYI